jgi:hypothetical protein
LTQTHLTDDAGLAPALQEVKGERSGHFDPLPDTEVGRQDKSGGTKVDRHRLFSRGKIGGVYVFALLLALALFLLHVVVIFDVAGELMGHKAWLLARFGQHSGKTVVLGCFFVLFTAHVLEAAAWGLFLRGARILPSVTDGIYFTAASITTLGYGDVLLKHPWRHLATLIAITGVLMFGCSTAFLFLVLQDVWQLHL